MADDMKEIAKLKFDVSTAEGQLKKLQEAFDKFNKEDKKALNDFTKTQNQITLKNADTLNKMKLQEQKYTLSRKNQYEKLRGQLDVLKEKELLKQMDINARKELEEQKTLNKIRVMNERASSSQKSIWDKFKSIATGVAIGSLVSTGLYELKQASADLITEMTDVEYKMVEIDRVLNNDSLNIDKYRDRLIQLAYDYGNSFDNVSDVTLRLAKAGFDANESLALTEKTLLALNTAELDATQATEDMVAVMSQWNLMTGDATKEAEDYAAIIDKINRTADNFPTTSEDILEALKRTSSAFRLSGATIDETIATIVAAEKTSQRGGKAIGTALNNIVQQLRDTGKLATMEAMGLDIYTNAAKTEFKSVMEILTELSSKMQELKERGKENSVEMQQLTSIFTLFRRNVGTSLLGEMGEDGTYQKVLDLIQAEDTIGYSMEENAKHMATAKAAMEQFNAELLKLKTSVWDSGGEAMFRSLLLLGTDLVKVFNVIVKTFGTVPLAIGAATLAFSTLNKNMKAINIVTDKTVDGVTELAADSIILKDKVQLLNAGFKNGEITANEFKFAVTALNVALSIGLSLAITAVITGINKLIHLEEDHIKKLQEEARNAKETIDGYKEEKNNIDELISTYEKLNSISEGQRTDEQAQQLKETQSQITAILREHGEIIDANTISYDEQVQKLKEISEKQLPNIISEYEIMLDKYRELNQPISDTGDAGFGLFEFGSLFKEIDVVTQKNRAGIKESLNDLFKLDNVEEQIKLLNEWQQQLRVARSEGKEVGDAYQWVSETLRQLNENNENVLKTQEALNEQYSDEAIKDYFNNLISDKNIETIQDYKNLLEEIYNSDFMPDEWTGKLSEFQDRLADLAEGKFPEIIAQMQEFNNAMVNATNDYDEQISILQNVSDNYSTLISTMNEYNASGEITIDTFNKLINNDLLQYLDLVDGQLVVNENGFINSANAAKEKAIADLQEQAAAQILSIAVNDLNIELEGSEEAGIVSARGSKTAAQAALEAAKAALQGATSFDAFNKAMRGQDINFAGLSAGAKKQIDNVIADVNKKVTALNKVTLSAAKSAASGAAKSAGSGAKQATKTFEEQSSERVKTFKEEIDKLISLEQDWVNKYKKLNLLSTSDLMFIQQQRINKYGDILNQINNLTGISEKDRTSLIQEYSKQRQNAELEYFDLLKSKLDEQIKKLKEANEERIKQIKETAEAQINALKKVDKENDKIKQKQEYERKRQELIYGNQGIEYWKQRTGREAQLALQDAEEKLRDLDEDWEEKKKDWTLEDQIEQIEKARDAQVKAIEDAQERQIEGWQKAYEEQVRLYAETGQIIYDNSVINAGYLYNAYMDNFVNPLQSQLQNVIASLNTASATASEVANKVGSTGGGGGSGGGTPTITATSNAPVQGPQPVSVTGMPTWSDIRTKSAVSSLSNLVNNIKNKVVPTIKKAIGMAHGGGEIRSNTEGLVLLRPQEVVLTPEWAAGMNKLVKQINQGNIIGGGNNTNIDVQGNLINMDGVKINDRKDADYLTEKIEKVFRDKFNVRK